MELGKRSIMQIQLKEITVAELTKNYQDNLENGVVGYDGKLDIRPPYQREFVYKPRTTETQLCVDIKPRNWIRILKN